MNKATINDYEDEIITEAELKDLVKNDSISFSFIEMSKYSKDTVMEVYNFRMRTKEGERISDHQMMMPHVIRTTDVRKSLVNLGFKVRYFEAGQIGF